MFTRSQAKLLRENKEQQQQQQQQQQQHQENEKSLIAIDRIKQYIIDVETIGCNDCCLTYCHKNQNRIRKIGELYEKYTALIPKE